MNKALKLTRSIRILPLQVYQSYRDHWETLGDSLRCPAKVSERNRSAEQLRRSRDQLTALKRLRLIELLLGASPAQSFLRGPGGRTKRTLVLCLCPGVDLGMPRAWVRAAKTLMFQFIGTWLFPPEETGVTSPKAAVCLACAIVETFCIPFVKCCLISFLFTLPYCRCVFQTVSFPAYKLYRKCCTSWFEIRHSLYKIFQSQRSCIYFLIP